MTHVEFHVLSERAPDARLRYACQLAEESAAAGVRVYLLTASPGETQRLDELLWTYNDRSFLPHEVLAVATPSHERVHVVLGELAPPPELRQMLINLADVVPAEVESYTRIAEIVDVEPERKRLARERYKEYRDRGCVLESRNV